MYINLYIYMYTKWLACHLSCTCTLTERHTHTRAKQLHTPNYWLYTKHIIYIKMYTFSLPFSLSHSLCICLPLLRNTLVTKIVTSRVHVYVWIWSEFFKWFGHEHQITITKPTQRTTVLCFINNINIQTKFTTATITTTTRGIQYIWHIVIYKMYNHSVINACEMQLKAIKLLDICCCCCVIIWATPF